MIEFINSSLKGSVIFIIGFLFGIIANLIGLTTFLSMEIFGIPLLFPMVFMFVFVGFFVIIFFRKDKIEHIKTPTQKERVR